MAAAHNLLFRGFFKVPSFVSWVGYGISAYCAVELTQTHVAGFMWSEGASMYPTMPADSSCSLISRLHCRGRGIKVGDIVEAQNPIFANELVGKRVLGMPGDYVILDPQLSPTSGGAPIPGIVEDDGTREEPQMIQVPEGHVWLIGDNLSWSRDSRFYGPMPMALITGKILATGTGPFSWTWHAGEQLTEVLD